MSLTVWILFAATPVPLLLALGMDLAQALEVAVAVLGLTVIAQMLPSLPGAVGTFHAACVVALRLMRPDIDLSSAIALALVFHFVSTIVPGLAGLLYLPGSWDHFQGALASRRGGRDRRTGS